MTPLSVGLQKLIRFPVHVRQIMQRLAAYTVILLLSTSPAKAANYSFWTAHYAGEITFDPFVRSFNCYNVRDYNRGHEEPAYYASVDYLGALVRCHIEVCEWRCKSEPRVCLHDPFDLSRPGEALPIEHRSVEFRCPGRPNNATGDLPRTGQPICRSRD